MLKVKNIDAFYENVQALWNVSFEVKKGEIVAIVGSNGAGKTTILRTISGLLHPNSGTIEFLGERIDNLPPHVIIQRGIAHIPEGRELFPFLTVLENLKIGSYVREARVRRGETLEWVFQLFPRLEERRSQLAGTLSGGEMQMLAIARGLMSRPKLLMLDEPSLGLAPKLVMTVFETVERLHDEGITILIVEQNVRHTLEIADRAYVLETGHVVLQGTGKELLNNPHVKKAYLGL
ncbi:MAG: ABC transporter ATP-binding protein [Candidatus Bathyarchaeia archaeon]